MITEQYLTDILRICKNSVETVFGPLIHKMTINDKGESVEQVMSVPMQILGIVVSQLCPRAEYHWRQDGLIAHEIREPKEPWET